MKIVLFLVALLFLTACTFPEEEKSSVLTTSSMPNPKLVGVWSSVSLLAGGYYDSVTREWLGKPLPDGLVYQLSIKDSQHFSFFIHNQDEYCSAYFYMTGLYEVKDNLLILTPETNQKVKRDCCAANIAIKDYDLSTWTKFLYRFHWIGEFNLELAFLYYNVYMGKLELGSNHGTPFTLRKS